MGGWTKTLHKKLNNYGSGSREDEFTDLEMVDLSSVVKCSGGQSGIKCLLGKAWMPVPANCSKHGQKHDLTISEEEGWSQNERVRFAKCRRLPRRILGGFNWVIWSFGGGWTIPRSGRADAAKHRVWPWKTKMIWVESGEHLWCNQQMRIQKRSVRVEPPKLSPGNWGVFGRSRIVLLSMGDWDWGPS